MSKVLNPKNVPKVNLIIFVANAAIHCDSELLKLRVTVISSEGIFWSSSFGQMLLSKTNYKFKTYIVSNKVYQFNLQFHI